MAAFLKKEEEKERGQSQLHTLLLCNNPLGCDGVTLLLKVCVCVCACVCMCLCVCVCV